MPEPRRDVDPHSDDRREKALKRLLVLLVAAVAR